MAEIKKTFWEFEIGRLADSPDGEEVTPGKGMEFTTTRCSIREIYEKKDLIEKGGIFARKEFWRDFELWLEK